MKGRQDAICFYDNILVTVKNNFARFFCFYISIFTLSCWLFFCLSSVTMPAFLRSVGAQAFHGGLLLRNCKNISAI